MSDNEAGSDERSGASPEDGGTSGGRRDTTGLLVKVGIAAVVVGWSYAPNLLELVRRWWEDPEYSHGFLVLPVALLLLRQRRAVGEAARSSPSWWGWLVVASALVARAVFYEKGKGWLETFTILPVIVGLVLALGGRGLLARAWPAVVFLIFLFPLPPAMNNLLSRPLQRLVTNASGALLRTSGLWVITEGNVIDLGDRGGVLEVAAACNGLAMLMTLAATVTTMILLIPMPNWRRLVLLASILPVAVFSNIIRVTATGWCYHLMGPGRGAHVAHDAAGWLMMPLALVLVWMEIKLLSWFFIEEDEERGGLALDPRLLNPNRLGDVSR